MKQTILPTRDYFVNTGPGNAEKGLHDEKALKFIQLIFLRKRSGKLVGYESYPIDFLRKRTARLEGYECYP